MEELLCCFGKFLDIFKDNNLVFISVFKNGMW